MGGRYLNQDDDFEMAVFRSLGNLIRENDDVARDMWSALANQDWISENGDTASYSFRAAGDLVSAVRGRGNYMDWYCSGPVGIVTDIIREALDKEGWKPIEVTLPAYYCMFSCS